MEFRPKIRQAEPQSEPLPETPGRARPWAPRPALCAVAVSRRRQTKSLSNKTQAQQQQSLEAFKKAFSVCMVARECP
jgi:hypothetical protein